MLHIQPIYIIHVSNLYVYNGFSTISHRIIDSRYPSRSLVSTREYQDSRAGFSHLKTTIEEQM